MARPLSELKGRTEQADDLALWVRKVTNGVQVRELERLFSHSKTSWTGLRNGTRLPDEKLVDDLVDKLIREPRLRESLRREGHTLRRAAEEAEEDLKAGRPLAARVSERRSEAATALLRLDDARLQQLEAMRRLATSEKRCVQLEGMVSVLQDQCVQLRAERHRARQQARAEVEQLQRALERSQELHRQADAQLAHARRAAGHAYELRVVAEEKASQAKAAARHALDDEPDTNGALLSPEALEPVLPPLDRMADALDQAAAELAEQDQELNGLREDLGLHHHPADTSGPVVVQGTAVAAHVAAACETGESTSAPAADHRPATDVLATSQDISPAPVAVVPDNAASRKDNVLNRIFSRNKQRSLTTPLSETNTLFELSWSLRLLRARAGRDVWTLERMAQAAWGDTAVAEQHDRIAAWQNGAELPAPRPAFLALVTALGADEEERSAFLAAHERTETFLEGKGRRLLMITVWILVPLSALVASLTTTAIGIEDLTPTNTRLGGAVMLNLLLTVGGGVVLLYISRGKPFVRQVQFFTVILGTWIVCAALTEQFGTAAGLWLADVIGIL
ncbi:hypothetical protein ACF09E_35505 [Streptomyces sp. NPDC014891]|uniref:hypothetical protein n=1 Tax=Streptomyces sp. NPDC014891 TaxID=3364929 RepID=UPI0037019E0F